MLMKRNNMAVRILMWMPLPLYRIMPARIEADTRNWVNVLINPEPLIAIVTGFATGYSITTIMESLL